MNPWKPKPKEPKDPITDLGNGVGMINNPTADMFKPGGVLNPGSPGAGIPKHDNTNIMVNGVPTPVQDVPESVVQGMSESEMKEYLEKLIQYGEEKELGLK